MEALKERGLLRQNAPHLVHDLAFVVPNYAWWEAPFYGIGLKLYDLLAFRYGFGRSRHLRKDEVLARIPNLEQSGLRGGVLYHDGQFDDARLLINLAQTAEEHGAALVNYAPVIRLTYNPEGVVNGVIFIDFESGEEHTVRARGVINATGAFSDAVRQLDDAAARPIIAPSQGVHVVLDGSFLAGDAAIMVPRTSDGRVLFAIPWHGKTLVGTTDTPIQSVSLEPVALNEEVDFLLDTASRYLARRPARSDILSVFAGIRPLANSSKAASTAKLSREHIIDVSRSGLLSIAGGKWTTYRKMAEDCVDRAAMLANLDQRPCVTESLRIHGHHEDAEKFGHLRDYGSDAAAIQEMRKASPELGQRFHPELDVEAVQVVWAVRHEMARMVDDVLARRTRAILLNAKAALALAPVVARLMATELGKNADWQREQVAQFTAIARNYIL
jgi:glycerol-3-phosphate dehydrogenase